MVLSAFSLIAVLASSFLARADVKPSEPSPGAVYNEGQMCPISWNADPDGSDVWKSMSIELMTGDNFNMVQLMSEYFSYLRNLTFIWLNLHQLLAPRLMVLSTDNTHLPALTCAKFPYS